MQNRDSSSRLMGILCGCLLLPLIASVCLGEEDFLATGTQYRLPAAESGHQRLRWQMRDRSAMALSSSSSFSDWSRFPAEEGYWLRMTDATAYFRDVLVAGETSISGATDGETWTADAVRPDGSMITWTPITFHSSYLGKEDCFVSLFWYTCDTTSIGIVWYTSAQCRPTGAWTMNFSNNGTRFFSGQFTLLPQIPPDQVPLFNQGAYNHAYDSICRTVTSTGKLLKDVFPCGLEPANEVPWTIAKKGCVLADASMVLGYHGASVDPPTLNTWFIDNAGYDFLGNVVWSAISRYAREVALVDVTFLGFIRKRDDPTMDTSTCTYGPQIIRVKDGQHWVAATGRNADKTTVLINDPDGGVTSTLASRYGNKYDQIRLFGGPGYSYPDVTGITIRFHSPGELLITDPLGRRTGFDPRTGQDYEGIPGSGYGTIGIGDVETGEPGPLSKELDIRQPIAGEYTIEVIGTGAGTYVLEIMADDPDLKPSKAIFKYVPISPSAVHTYRFDFAKTVGFELEVVGGFDGGGQRPKDVNRFLRYSNPSESQTQLAAGTTTYALMIFYDKTIIPTSFKAVLNGVDISSRFNPTPGSHQIVNLNVQKGRNVLVLSVDGNLPSRVATDTDRLVFTVP